VLNVRLSLTFVYAPDLAGGAYSTPPDPLVVFKGTYF